MAFKERVIGSFAKVKEDMQGLKGQFFSFASQQKDFNADLYRRIVELEKENLQLKNDLKELKSLLEENVISAELRKYLQEA